MVDSCHGFVQLYNSSQSFLPKRHWTSEFPNSHTKQWSVLPAATLCTSSWPASLAKPHGIPVPHGKPSQPITTNCHWHSGSPVSEQDGIDPIESHHGRTTVILKIPDNWHFVDLSRWIVNSTVPAEKCHCLPNCANTSYFKTTSPSHQSSLQPPAKMCHPKKASKTYHLPAHQEMAGYDALRFPCFVLASSAWRTKWWKVLISWERKVTGTPTGGGCVTSKCCTF